MAFVYLGELISNTAVHQHTKIVAVHSITLSKHLPMFRLNPSDIKVFSIDTVRVLVMLT